MKTSVNAALVIGLLAAGFAGCPVNCTVGSGVGQASGPMYIANCAGYDGSRTDPITFDLQPSFFAAEAVEDIGIGAKRNRLTIRLQRVGGNPENADVLLLNIVNSFEVARCLRGRMELTSTGEEQPDYDTSVCYWPTREGPPRMRVGPNDYIRASFTPYGSCRPNNRPLNVVGTAIACTGQKRSEPCPSDPAVAGPDKWLSYIEFDIFGSINRADKSASEVNPSFEVDFGERLLATAFHFTIQDDRLLSDDVVPTPPPPRIKGTLDGWFDFDFERGRAVQTFP